MSRPGSLPPSAPRRGELWLVLTPGQPDDPHQPRPALVVSDDVRNRMTDDLIVVPIFPSGRPGPTRVQLPAGGGGQDHDSVVFCEEVTTIDRDFLRRGPLGQRLDAATMDAVVRGIRRALGEVVPNA
ncbi:MAG: type II toxin-antitoxin system PemK/MazF family toxin [Candidatus Dormibacteria bacterium]